jgi:MFS family permease
MTPRHGSTEARHYRRNSASFIAFESLWGAGIPFFAFQVVAPAYLAYLGCSNLLLGFAQNLPVLCSPLMLVSGVLFARRNRRANTIALFAAASFCIIVYGAIAALLKGRLGNSALAWGFCVAMGLRFVFENLAQPNYVSLTTEVIPILKRGRLYGFRTLGYGIGSILTGIAASRLFGILPAPDNYLTGFLIAGVLFGISCAAISFSVDDRIPTLPKRRTSEIAGLLTGNLEYRKYICGQALISVAASLGGFVVVFARKRFALPADLVGTFTMVFTLTNAGMGVIIGLIADKYGYRVILILQAVFLCIFYSMALAAANVTLVYVAYGFYSVVFMSLMPVMNNLIAEICPGVDAGNLGAVNQVLLLPLVLIAGALAGARVDATSRFAAVFAGGLVMAALACAWVLLFVKEPRDRASSRSPHG